MMRIYKHSRGRMRQCKHSYGVDSSTFVYYFYDVVLVLVHTEGEKSTDVNVEVLSAASALRECLMVVSRGRN